MKFEMAGRRDYIIRFVAILLFCCISATIANKPLHLDSMDFASAAKATAETGRPVYYRGEENPNHLGLWHPPLYIYALAFWFKIFGAGAAQGRTFGMICALLNAWIVLRIVQTLFGRGVRSSFEPWFWPIFLLNPYTIQTAAILDIDSTIYGPLLCLVLLAVLRLTWRDGRKREDEPSRIEYAWIVIALAAAFWAKLTTVLLVVPFTGLLLVARFRFWRAARIAALTAAAGAGLFLLTYLAYGALLHLDVKYTLSFTLFSFLNRGSSGHAGLASRLLDFRNNAEGMVPFMIRWTGLLPWAALGAAISITGWTALSSKSIRAQHCFLLLLLAGATTLYYCGQTQTFGSAPFKYTVVFWGLALVSPFLLALSRTAWGDHVFTEPIFAFKPAAFLVAAVLWIASAFYGRYVLMDLQLRDYRTVIWAALIPTALMLLFQSTVPYSTTYDYGQLGIEETAAFIRLNTSPDDQVACMKDVGYMTGRRYFENYGGLNAGPQAARNLITALASGRIKLAVFTEGYGQDRLTLNDQVKDWVESHCTNVASFGNYRIYKVNAP